MAISAIAPPSPPTYPSHGDDQEMESQARSLQKQIAALEKNAQVEPQMKAEELAELEASKQQLEMEMVQARISARASAVPHAASPAPTHAGAATDSSAARSESASDTSVVDVWV